MLSSTAMSFIFACGFVCLLIGCVGLVEFCLGCTQPVLIAGPLNMSPFGDPLFTAIGLLVLGCLFWLGLYATRVWSGIQGLLCATTAIVLITIMVCRRGNLSDDVHWSSGGRYAPADLISFWLFSVPVIVLLALGCLRFFSRCAKYNQQNH